MKTKKPSQSITIGSINRDAELIDKILAYKKEKGLRSAPDAVRSLCEDALAIKKATK